MDKNLRPYIAELVGTFALVFLGAGTVCMAKLATGDGQPQPYVVGIALAQGFILAALLTGTASISGGYLNPAITLMFWVFKRIDGVKALWLVGAQLLGAVLAGLCIHFMFTEQVLRDAGYGTPHMYLPVFGGTAGGWPDLKMLITGILIEIGFTFIFTFAIFATMIDPRAPRLGGLGPGLALTAITVMGYGLTGACVNPARWIGPAIWELTSSDKAFRDNLVYWVGPVVGALAAGGLYYYVILPEEKAQAEAPATTAAHTGAPERTSTLFKAKK